ncbi:MAG: hypothetical protein JWM16_4467 [Verrucomicrobiales bacterium]|nr:hypothetical protein [Verrucomicrobiales bacterium]
MKTEIENRIQDSGKQDARPGCDSNAMSAIPQYARPAAPDQTDLSYPTDSPGLHEAAINSQPTNPTIHSITQPITPVVRGRSQSEPSPVFFVRRQAQIKPHHCTRRKRGHEFLIDLGSPFARPHISYLSRSTAKSSRTDWNALSRVIAGCHAFARIKNLEPKPFEPAPELTQIKSQSTPPCRSLLPLFPSVISDRRPRTPDFRRYPQASSHLKQGYASLGKATQASKEKSSASLACKASFLCPMATPQPFARKRPDSLRFVARNCALSLIIARYVGIPWHFLLSRCDRSGTACPRRPNRNTHFYTGFLTLLRTLSLATIKFVNQQSRNHQSAMRSSPFLYFQTLEMIKTGGLRNELRTPVEI